MVSVLALKLGLTLGLKLGIGLGLKSRLGLGPWIRFVTCKEHKDVKETLTYMKHKGVKETLPDLPKAVYRIYGYLT